MAGNKSGQNSPKRENWLCRKPCQTTVWCCRLAKTVKWGLVVLVVAGMYLSLAGFPESCTLRVKEEFHKRGMTINFDRLRLDLLRGVVADEVELALDASSPALNCEEIHVNMNWFQWKSDAPLLDGVGIRGGTLRAGALGILPAPLVRPWLTLSNLNTYVRFEADGFRLSNFRASIQALPIFGSGFIRRDAAAIAVQPAQVQLPATVTDAVDKPSTQAFLDRLWPVIESMEWGEDCKAEFEFLVDADHPSEHDIHINAGGRQVLFRGVPLEDCQADFHLSNSVLRIQEISAGHLNKRARLAGSLHLMDHVVEIHGYSGLEPSCLMSLLPWSWGDAVARSIQIGEGGLEAECWAGPVPVQELGRELTGWVKLKQATYRGMWIEEGFASWEWEKPTLKLNRVKVQCGTGRAQGVLDGDFTMDTAAKSWRSKLVTTVDPHVLLPITPTNLVMLIHRFEFTDTNPNVDLELRMERDPSPRLEFTGSFEAENFSYQGASGLSTKSGIQYSNRAVRLDPFHVQRDEGEVTGWLAVNGPEKMSTFKFASSVHPQAMGQLIHTNTGALFRKLGVEGVGQWTAEGRADYGAKTNSSFMATARLRNARLWHLRSDDLNLTLHRDPTNMQFQIAPSEFFDGSVTGKIDIAQDRSDRAYASYFQVDDVAFSQVLGLLNTNDHSDVEGRIHSGLAFAGTLKPFQLLGTVGQGGVKINKGTILRVPLFGGLSRFLSKLFPGLGFAAQRDLTATYQLKDGTLFSDDLSISGHVVSIHMDGSYRIGNDLRFDVIASPLGRGVVADVVKLITLPFSKLLEFRLEGTLQEPEWRPKYWPKELFSSEDRQGEESANEGALDE